LRQSGHGVVPLLVLEMTMKLIHKVALGAAILVTATAASFPHGIGEMLGAATETFQEREALRLCQAQDPAFIRFVSSQRQDCYRRMGPVVGMPAALTSAKGETGFPAVVEH
jgi:hypothetical protein